MLADAIKESLALLPGLSVFLVVTFLAGAANCGASWALAAELAKVAARSEARSARWIGAEEIQQLWQTATPSRTKLPRYACLIASPAAYVASHMVRTRVSIGTIRDLAGHP